MKKLPKIFQNELEKYNIKCNVPSEEEYTILRDVIEAVKQDNYTDETKEKFLDLVNRSQYVILGCTELPILYNRYHDVCLFWQKDLHKAVMYLYYFF